MTLQLGTLDTNGTELCLEGGGEKDKGGEDRIKYISWYRLSRTKMGLWWHNLDSH